MQEAKQIAINIIASDALPYLPNFFASLEAQGTNDFSVMVVDNASQDDAAKWIQSQYPEVAVLRNFRDQGFARAANQAAELALLRWPAESLKDRFILLADPAIEFGDNSLFHLKQAMLQNPSLGAVCPKILLTKVTSVSEDDRRESERTNILFSTGLRIDKFRRIRHRGAGQTDGGQCNAAAEIFGVPAECGLYRASDLVLAKIRNELFDEDMVNHAVDADLAWRMKRLGCSAGYVPEATAYLQRSSRKTPKQNQTRNIFWMILKNDEFGNVLLHTPWLTLSAAAFFLGSLFSWTRAKLGIESLVKAPKFFGKRKQLAKQVKIKGAAMRRWLA